jgi:hypothetical protein
MPKARPQTINKASLADIVDEHPGLKLETPCRRTQEPFISSATAPTPGNQRDTERGLSAPQSAPTATRASRSIKNLHIMPGQGFHLFIVCKGWLEPPRGSPAAAASLLP